MILQNLLQFFAKAYKERFFSHALAPLLALAKNLSEARIKPSIDYLVNRDFPPSELSDQRMSREAQVLIGSGTITTAGTLGFLCYYIMANPAIRNRLGEELKDVMEGYPAKKPTWAQLERFHISKR